MSRDHSSTGNAPENEISVAIEGYIVIGAAPHALFRKSSNSEVSRVIFRRSSDVYGSRVSDYAQYNPVSTRKPLTNTFSGGFSGIPPPRFLGFVTSIHSDRYMKGQSDWMDKAL